MITAWNELLQAAMLGTERSRWNGADLPPEIGKTALPEGDTETRFLQQAALLLNYRRCGLLPSLHKGALPDPAPIEDRPYCPQEVLPLLKEILETGSTPLLQLWLQACADRQYIAPPELLPLLLDIAGKQTSLQPLIAEVAGHRGIWLSRLNPFWQFESPQNDNIWETGSLQQREAWLRNQRKADAAAGRSFLQAVWGAEHAATRTQLLSALEVGLSEADETWLNELLREKSARVREEALHLLKLLPTGGIIRQYEEVLSPAIFLKTEKGLLGIGSKTALEVILPQGSTELYRTGLEKTSSEKGVSDEAHLLFQLVSGVPPSFWERHLQREPAEITDLFAKHKSAASLLPALSMAAARFRDTEWASVLSKKSNVFHPHLLTKLSGRDWEAYVLRHLEAQSEHVLPHLLSRPSAWSTELAKAVLKHTAQNTYRYPAAWYNQIAHLLPVEVAPQLEKCTPNEPHLRDMWSKISDHIFRLLTLKTTIPLVFSASQTKSYPSPK